MSEKKLQTLKDFVGNRKCKDTHIQLFEHLSEQPDNVKPAGKALLILCTPRCGSTLFCEALNSCGLLGVAEEWFNYDYFAAWMTVMGRNVFDLSEYTNWLYDKTCRDTGTWVVKWHVGQLVAMNQDFSLGMESMDFHHVVYLCRRDKIAQAVSLVKAVTTDCYRSTEKETLECRMSRPAIASGLESITRFDNFARSYLWQYVNKSYAYEDFKCLGHESYNNTLKAMGKPASQFSVKTIKRQADHRNAQAIKDFRAYILGEIE